MICLCLTGATLAEWTGQLERNRAWASMVELRVDLLRPAERSADAIGEWWNTHSDGLPGILTVRRLRDQGHWEGDDAQRLFLLSRLLDAVAPEYLDIELDRQSSADWTQLARRQEDRGGYVIRSYHGSVVDHAEIAALMARLATNPHEIPKLAIEPTGLSDTTALLRAAREFRRRMPGRTAVWIAMGEYGLPSRVAPALFGSAWSYCSDPDGQPAAPGQVSPQLLAETYRVGEATADWQVLAVVGAPVAHSKSPVYHNPRLRADGVSAVYVPVRADVFGEFVEFADEAGIRGASVTVPHKESALALATGEAGAGASELAQRTGAANTLVRRAENAWWADNTDVEGLMAPLRKQVGAGEGRRAAVIGAGGAARAAVAGLLADGWQVEVYNRTPERAAKLAGDLGLDAAAAHSMSDLRDLESGTVDLLVQTTPVGMAHGVQGDPAEGYEFAGSETVYDLVYTPSQTALIVRAAAAGCTTITGEAMFELQAAAQYELFRAALAD